MKASGPRVERETVIIFNDAEDTAQVHTFSDVIFHKLTKRGWVPRIDDERHAIFEMPKSKISLLSSGKSKRRGPGFGFKKKIVEQILPPPQEDI